MWWDYGSVTGEKWRARVRILSSFWFEFDSELLCLFYNTRPAELQIWFTVFILFKEKSWSDIWPSALGPHRYCTRWLCWLMCLWIIWYDDTKKPPQIWFCFCVVVWWKSMKQLLPSKLDGEECVRYSATARTEHQRPRVEPAGIEIHTHTLTLIVLFITHSMLHNFYPVHNPSL